MKRIALDDSSRSALGLAAHGISSSPYESNFQKFLLSVGNLIQILPHEIRNEILKLRLQSFGKGILLIDNLPIDDFLGDTPLSHNDLKSKQTYVSESIVGLIGLLLGTPFSYDSDNHKAVIRSIFPQARKSENKNYFGAQNLTPHSDMACAPLRPDFIILFCLRSSIHEPVATQVASLSDILLKLERNSINELTKPQFRLGLPESLRVRNQNKMYWSPLTSVLCYLNNYPEIRYNSTYIEALTTSGKESLNSLNECMNEFKIDIALHAGQALIIDNRKCLHARNSFSVKLDGKDRWIHQSYVVQSLWNHRYALLDDHVISLAKLLS